jgi:hypothetical protein
MVQTMAPSMRSGFVDDPLIGWLTAPAMLIILADCMAWHQLISTLIICELCCQVQLGCCSRQEL